MNETIFSSKTFTEGDSVRYVKGTRRSLYSDRIGTVKAVRRNASGEIISAGVHFDNIDSSDSDEDLVWASVHSWRKIPALIPQNFDVDSFFTHAAGGPLEVAKAELARLEARVAELKAAIKVIESI